MVYLLTWSTYGSRLHGDPRLTVGREHRSILGPFVDPNPRRETFERKLMKEPEFLLLGIAPETVLRAVLATAAFRKWALLAAHVRRNHVHAVVATEGSPSAALNGFKANATRELKASGLTRERFWTRGGSTRSLPQWDKVVAAVDYVVCRQGDPIAVWVSDDYRP